MPYGYYSLSTKLWIQKDRGELAPLSFVIQSSCLFTQAELAEYLAQHLVRDAVAGNLAQ